MPHVLGIRAKKPCRWPKGLARSLRLGYQYGPNSSPQPSTSSGLGFVVPNALLSSTFSPHSSAVEHRFRKAEVPRSNRGEGSNRQRASAPEIAGWRRYLRAFFFNVAFFASVGFFAVVFFAIADFFGDGFLADFLAVV